MYPRQKNVFSGFMFASSSVASFPVFQTISLGCCPGAALYIQSTQKTGPILKIFRSVFSKKKKKAACLFATCFDAGSVRRHHAATGGRRPPAAACMRRPRFASPFAVVLFLFRFFCFFGLFLFFFPKKIKGNNKKKRSDGEMHSGSARGGCMNEAYKGICKPCRAVCSSLQGTRALAARVRMPVGLVMAMMGGDKVDGRPGERGGLPWQPIASARKSTFRERRKQKKGRGGSEGGNMEEDRRVII